MNVKKFLSVALTGLVFLAAGRRAQIAAPQGQGAPDSTFLNQYCVTCHNQRTRIAGLALETLDITHPGENAEVWEKVIRKLRTGMMPPSGASRPDRATIDAFAANLENAL